MLSGIPNDALEGRVREALQAAFTARNAVVLADVLGDHRHLNEIRRLTASKPETALLMEQLIARKSALFANDDRLIGNWEVTLTEDGINVHADARDPRSLSPIPGRQE